MQRCKKFQWQINRSNLDVVARKIPSTGNCIFKEVHTAVSREAWAALPESSSRPLPATLAQSRNLAHASLETAVLDTA